MRPTLSLIRREFAAYFATPIGYAAFFSFLTLTGLLFNLALTLLTQQGPRGVEYPMQVFLGGAESPPEVLVAGVLFWGLFPAVTGIITMRLVAEERATGSLEMLLTAPIRDWQVVAAKFIACYAFYLLLWIPTLVYLPILLDLHAEWKPAFDPYSIAMLAGMGLMLVAIAMLIREADGLFTLLAFGLASGTIGVGGWLHYGEAGDHLVSFSAGIDPYPVLTSYLGVLLAGAMFLSLGLFVSSFGAQSARSLDAGSVVGTRLRIASAVALVVRDGDIRL